MTSSYERSTDFLYGGGRRRRQIVSPEGVTLTVELADYGERATAFAIDLCLWLAALFIVYLPLAVLRFHDLGGTVVVTVLLFLGFLVRNAYFLHFELAWRGATPGKRVVGLRVVDRQGGPLLPTAVIARNLTREFEIFIPLGILLSVGSLGTEAWAQWLSAAWVLCLAALPLLNRDRMRGGDLIAGTVVIALPRRALMQDLAQTDVQYSFSDRQLMAYGAFELQVLEELLRGADAPQAGETLREVGDKIRRKIGWTTPVPVEQEVPFLKAFYTAERAFLEREQLFGTIRSDKHYGGDAKRAEG